LLLLLEHVHDKRFGLELVAHKTSHAVANIFGVKDRGYVREGYFADLVLVDMNRTTEVSREQILYKCGWSPFEGVRFRSSIAATLVNGEIAWRNGKLCAPAGGQRLELTGRR
jgi:dihydroorotase